jgi:Protein of unknown function (DUF992)
MRRFLSALAAIVLVATAAMPASTQGTASWTQAGMLHCRLDPSIGFIIAGHQSMHCRFTQRAYAPEFYEGALNTVGLDIGISAGGLLNWAVLAPTTGVPQGALAGEYVGASGDVAVGLGLGANVLIGGSRRTFSLQPVSVEGSAGMKVALGVSALHLRPVF